MQIATFLESVVPFDHLPAELRLEAAQQMQSKQCAPGEFIYRIDDPLSGIFIIMEGEVETLDRYGAMVSLLVTKDTFGERGLLRDGLAATTARAKRQSRIIQVPAALFRELFENYPFFRRYFDRRSQGISRGADIATQKVANLIIRDPISCAPDTPAAEAARIMRKHHISSLGVVEPGTERLAGIVTIRDLSNRVLAENLNPNTPVSEVMTRNPASLPPHALGTDVLQLMMQQRIGHLPVVEHGRFVGMVTQTDLTRFHAASAPALVKEVSEANTVNEMAALTQRLPYLLMQLVAANDAHEVITRAITDVTDTITRRLLALAEAELGPPPVPYLWLACGSQGRQEQTGVSDQDNCLFLDDSVTPDDMPYFAELAKRVCDGLNACGYIYCPGEMMATNPQWCQPVHVWRNYFHTWATTHEPRSHMLASVMFDLRPIAGTASLYRDLQAETLEEASKNTIFVAHMIANSLKHVPPLGLFRGFAVNRTGPWRNHIDMKHNGVIPVTDLARVYALQGRITEVNTRARLTAAEAAGIVSASGGRELIEAYDVIATMRLQNQAAQAKYGREISNYLAPSQLSDFERHHLRNAFVVVRTMQSAISHEGVS